MPPATALCYNIAVHPLSLPADLCYLSWDPTQGVLWPCARNRVQAKVLTEKLNLLLSGNEPQPKEETNGQSHKPVSNGHAKVHPMTPHILICDPESMKAIKQKTEEKNTTGILGGQLMRSK